MKCIVTDDEPLARECISDYIEELDYLELVATCEHPLQTMQALQKEPVDLLFMDIEMPKMSGLDFLKSLKNPPMVILTTAYQNYAIEGFQLDVIDYLLKPITFNRFFKAVTKAKELYDLRQQPPQPTSGQVTARTHENASADHCFIKVENRFEKVLFEEILFVEGMQNYVTFHTKTGKLATLMTLKSVEENLPPEQFIRTHKSYIAAKNKIQKIEGNEIFIGGNIIPISRNLRDDVLGKVVNDTLWKK